MKIQIKNISAHQTSKVLSITMACVTLPLILVGIFGQLFVSEASDSSYRILFWFLIFAPVIYGLVGYLIIRVCCHLYNGLAQRLGGIEFITDS